MMKIVRNYTKLIEFNDSSNKSKKITPDRQTSRIQQKTKIWIEIPVVVLSWSCRGPVVVQIWLSWSCLGPVVVLSWSGPGAQNHDACVCFVIFRCFL